MSKINLLLAILCSFAVVTASAAHASGLPKGHHGVHKKHGHAKHKRHHRHR